MPKSKVESIQERNRRVELDKAWETSLTRRTIIAIITYAVAVIFLILIEANSPLLTALVPTGGYILSTLTLSPIKRLWTHLQ